MLSVAALFADVEIAEPSPRLQARVMRRVRHHEFRARLARGMGLSLIGLLALIGVGLLVMVGAWSVAVGNSSLGHAIVLVATQFANTLRTIVHAVGLMSQAALGGPIGLVVLAGLVITGMLTVQWLRMLSRPMTSRA